jgi:hypothetical protein
MATIERVEISQSEVNGVVLVLPGILARSAEQYGPLVSMLMLHGSVIGYDYTGSAPMQINELVDLVFGDIDMAAKNSQSITLIGSSLGGMQLPFIVGAYRVYGLRKDIPMKSIIIDAPTGAETMVQVPLGRFGETVVMSPFGQLLKPLAYIKIGPKDSLIHVPETEELMIEVAGKAMTSEQWRSWVKDRAVKGLSGHSARLWLSQLRWMISVGRNGLLEERCRALQDDDITYIACLGSGNDVVCQPAAASWWEEVLNAEVVKVEDGVHCGYLQQACHFREVLSKVMAG